MAEIVLRGVGLVGGLSSSMPAGSNLQTKPGIQSELAETLEAWQDQDETQVVCLSLKPTRAAFCSVFGTRSIFHDEVEVFDFFDKAFILLMERGLGGGQNHNCCGTDTPVSDAHRQFVVDNKREREKDNLSLSLD